MSEEQEQAVAKELAELDARIEAAQTARDETAAAEELPYKRQRAVDMERVAELETQYGNRRIWKIDVEGWVPKETIGASLDAATLIAIKLPLRSEKNWQRFQTEVLRYSEEKHRTVATVEQLARVCMAYPSYKDDRALYDVTIEILPAAFTTAANLIHKLAGGKADKDGKK
jgi:hypothetical protein